MPRYKPIPGLDGYRASTLGTIQSCWLPGRYPVKTKTWHTLKPHEHFGRRCVCIRNRRKGEIIRPQVGRLVLLAWRGPAPDGKPYVWHRDDVTTNDRLTNLAWSAKQQQRVGKRRGRPPKHPEPER